MARDWLAMGINAGYMVYRESYLKRLEKLAREQEEPLRGTERLKSRLAWEDWEWLRAEAVKMAGEEIRRRRWRGARGGLLPGGYGAEDVADSVIQEIFEGKGRLAIGWTREKVIRELKRLVGQRVRVLNGRKENRVLRSEWDVEPPDADGKPVSVFEKLRGLGGDG